MKKNVNVLNFHVDLFSMDIRLYTMLAQENLNIIKLLLDKGANIHVSSNVKILLFNNNRKNGMTVLHCAVYSQLRNVQLLAINEMNLDKTDNVT